jgi:hypothetical protein
LQEKGFKYVYSGFRRMKADSTTVIMAPGLCCGRVRGAHWYY